MRLSDVDIEQKIASGDIIIDPPPGHDAIAGISVDLRLDHHLRAGGKRGDKAKEFAKKAAKAKSGISQAQNFMKLSTNLSDDVRAQADEFITTIQGLLEAGDNTKAASTAKKLGAILEP